MNADEVALATLGYKQEFKRHFTYLELFGLSFSIIGVVQSIAAVLVYSIPYGGPVSMVWGWLTGSVFILCIAASIAELGSAAPTSGGLYYWTFALAPEVIQKYLAWLIGYTNTIGYMSGVAGFDYSCALSILTAASIASDGNFIPTTAQIYGVFCAVVVSHAALASLATKLIARLQLFFIFLNMSVFIGLLVVVPIKTPSGFQNEASYAFGHFENISGYPNGFAFFMSLLAPLWSIGGFDSSVHISEEAQNAKIAVPFAIMTSTGFGCLLGFAVNILLAFNMGTDLVSIISSPFGQPMAVIFLNCLGKSGTMAFWILIVVLLYMSGLDLLLASSRQTFAFSRDGALPFSKVLYHMNATTATPVYCVLFSGFIACILGLLSFAGTAAIGAIFSMGVVCQYICYLTPIVLQLFFGKKFSPGPFSLGNASFLVSGLAVAFMVFMIVVLMFPTAPAPTASSMNYTVVVVGGTLLLSTLYYLVSGRLWFSGPVCTVDGGANADHVNDKIGEVEI
ncbi:hypothetical protein GYMLUDRAFT_207812 [Collybiopsis luxurians FD-317 M1]|uniref:Amino acid transporter n=1 Tax=Collybiopsis luxurians FD-317 M1 TaxID=944289 RepID=A0A0D0CCX1_9AGAR|nr:hypothetical protein GYMLUDRAFT_207812 [Collybiopsis luxurians FD-317 M1]